PEPRAYGRDRDPVLAGARLGDDARLAHAPRELDLAEAVVDLVAARVIELIAFEVDLRAFQVLSQALGEIERARPAAVVLEQIAQLGLEGRIVLRLLVGLLQFEDERHERLGDEAAAVEAEETEIVGAGTEAVRRLRLGCGWRSHGL